MSTTERWAKPHVMVQMCPCDVQELPIKSGCLLLSQYMYIYIVQSLCLSQNVFYRCATQGFESIIQPTSGLNELVHSEFDEGKSNIKCKFSLLYAIFYSVFCEYPSAPLSQSKFVLFVFLYRCIRIIQIYTKNYQFFIIRQNVENKIDLKKHLSLHT